MNLTQPAQRVVRELNHSWHINWQVRLALLEGETSIRAAEDSPNLRFFGDVESYLSARQITHAADLLLTYCQAILAEIVRKDPSQASVVCTAPLPKDPIKCVSQLENFASGTSGPALKGLRDFIKARWSRELEVIVKLRHILVHCDGWDPRRLVNDVVTNSKFPWCPIPPTDLPPSPPPFSWSETDFLLLDSRHAHWATRHIQHHIYLMDQNLSHRFSLPCTRYVQRSSGRSFHTNSITLPDPPGTPLPHKRNFTPSGQTASETPDLPNYDETMNPLEKQCTEAWHIGKNELDKWIRDYCGQTRVAIRRVNCGLAGTIQGHTCKGHDVALEYFLSPDDSDSKGEWLCIRFRQKDFQPFLTVWSSHSQMCDFNTLSLNEGLKEFLMKCIDKALAQ